MFRRIGRALKDFAQPRFGVLGSSKAEESGILNFYMGKNTPERKDYIIENLVVPVEDRGPRRIWKESLP